MSEKICPYCNEPNQFEDGRESMFCINCGKKLYLRDFREVTCPQCHNDIRLPMEKPHCFCPECGAELRFDSPEVEYHSEMSDPERAVLHMTDKELDRRHARKIEKMRNKTAIKLRTVEADEKNNKFTLRDLFVVLVLLSFMVALPFVIQAIVG